MSFNEKLPDWENPGTEPPESKKQTGFLPAEKPPADWFNWLFHRNYKALEELRSKAETVDNKNRPDGYAGLDNIGKIPTELLPDDQEIVLPDASLTQKGITQLSSATDSTSEAMAATPKAVKAAYDRGSAGVTAAATAQSRADSAFNEATAAKQLGVEQKANVVAALNSIGVPASTSESWAQLIPKISAIIRATGNATAADLLAGKSASNASGPFNGSMPNRSAENHHMPGLASTVWAGDRFFIQPPHGYYNGSSWVTAAVPGLTAANLRAGVDVAGLIGTLVEGKRFATGQFIIPTSGLGVVNNLAFRPRTIVFAQAGWDGVSWIVGVYSEETLTGSNILNATFDQMKGIIRSGGITPGDGGFTAVATNSDFQRTYNYIALA